LATFAEPKRRSEVHDFATGKLRDRSAHGLEQIGRKSDGAVFHALQIVRTGDRLLEPAERLGRHRHGEEALDVELHDLGLQLLEQLLAAAVVDPAETFVGVEAEHRAGAEQ